MNALAPLPGHQGAPELSATLLARKAVHGDFTDHARITQGLKDIVHASPSWPRMTPIARESVEMILHKIGRICAGDPTHSDHWHDIGGYSRLVEERLSAAAEPTPLPLPPAGGEYAGLSREAT